MKKQDRVPPPYYFFSKDYLSSFLKVNRKVALFLDYDGTLVPIQKDSRQCFLSDKVKNQLRLLAEAEHCYLFILSGRALSDITKRVGIKEIYYGGNHGLDISGPDIRYTHPKAIQSRPVINYAKRKLKNKIGDIEGAWLEDKKFTLSLHFRLVRKEEVIHIKKIFYKTLEEFPDVKYLSVLKGKKVLELVPNVSCDKGKAISYILDRLKNKCLPIYIGDDKTDENAFKAIRNKGITVRIGKSKKTAANFYLKRQSEILKFLKEVHRLIAK